VKFGHFIRILDMAFQKVFVQDTSINPRHQLILIANLPLRSDSLDKALTIFSFSGVMYGITGKKYGMEK
jgi:hypothetical protein